HEEGGHPVDVGGLPRPQVPADRLLDVQGLEVLLPEGDVEPDLARVLLELVVREVAVVREQDVLHLPELVLIAGGDRRVGGGHWESEDSTMVAGAFFGPRTGDFSRGMS